MNAYTNPQEHLLVKKNMQIFGAQRWYNLHSIDGVNVYYLFGDFIVKLISESICRNLFTIQKY